jgi:hypothetical protein
MPVQHHHDSIHYLNINETKPKKPFIAEEVAPVNQGQEGYQSIDRYYCDPKQETNEHFVVLNSNAIRDIWTVMIHY